MALNLLRRETAARHKQVGNPVPVAIGFTVGACIVVFGPLTGASLNPARTLGPAVATGNYADIWLYMVATFGSAALAGLYDRWFMLSKDEASG